MALIRLKFPVRRATVLTASVFGLLALGCSSTAAPTALPTTGLTGAGEALNSVPKPVARYSFDGDAADSSGNGNGGSENGAVPVTGHLGVGSTALSFNGEIAHIVIPDSDSLDLADQFSFSVWLNHGEVDPGRFFTIFEKSGDSGGHARYGAWLFDGGVEVCVEPATNAPLVGPQSCFDSELKLEPGEWHHVAGVYDGNMISIFINGAAAGSRAFGGTGISTNGAPLFVVTDRLAPSPVYTPITLDDLQIFDVALSKEQMLVLFEGE